MKQILTILIICTYHIQSLQSQTIVPVEFEYNNAIKFSPFNLGQSEFQAAYEHFFGNRRSSVSIYPSIFLREVQDNQMQGWQAMLQYRFYLSHINKEERHTFLKLYNYGFYAGLYGLYFDYSEDYRDGYWSNTTNEYMIGDFTQSAQSVEGGAMIGLQIDITKRILLDFYVGGGIRKSAAIDTFYDTQEDENYYDSYGVLDPGYTGVKPKIGLQIGVSF